MSRSVFGIVVLIVVGLFGCARSTDSEPSLRPSEQLIVDTYVRIAVLEALQRDHPDSVEALFEIGLASIDTVAVMRAADSLASRPLEWERVFDAIHARLTELEELPDQWWSVARGDPLPPE